MLSKRNSGKYLDSEYLEWKNAAIQDSDSLTDWEKDFLEIEFPEGTNKYQTKAYLISTQALSPRQNKLDIRNSPKTGGSGFEKR